MLFLSKKNPFRRLYRISFKSAGVICLPILILIGWMIFDAYLDYHRFVEKVCLGLRSQEAPAINLDIMHMYLNEGVKKVLIRSTAPEMPTDNSLSTLQMSIDPENLAKLNYDLPWSGKEQYYRTYVNYNGKSYTVKARYRGGGHWHWFGKKKSWRIKTKKDKLIEGVRKINIVNPKTILSFEEAFSMQLAEKIGLLAPRCFPIKLILNNQYMGLYYFWDQVDESLLRRNNKMPGSIYSDNGPLIWKNEKHWKKVASRNADTQGDRRDIQLLINAINKYNLPTFRQFAQQHIDLDNYMRFAAFDNISGTSHHDYAHNHKLYFDPIIGKFLSIPWDVHQWHPPENVGLDFPGTPLLNKLKQIPEFDLIRHKILWELLDKTLPEDTVQGLLTDLYNKIYPAVSSDPFKDSIDAMPRDILKFPDVGLSSFSTRSFINKYHRYQDVITQRYAFLKKYLSKDSISLVRKKIGSNTLLKIVANGNVGSRITAITIRGKGSHFKIYKDTNRNHLIDISDQLIGKGSFKDGICKFPINTLILPGYKYEKNPNPSLSRGTHLLKPSPLEYPYIFSGDISIDNLSVAAQNAVTGKTTLAVDIPASDSTVNATDSLHPWELPAKPVKKSVSLGPGKIIITRTETYPGHISLMILPGTTLRLGKGVSIFCYGKVTAKGTPDRPIRFEAVDSKKPWGVFVLQGKGSSGSVFEHCIWQGGSEAKKDLIYYSGMVSMHGVDDLTVKDCTIGRNYLGDDAMHLAYCKNFIVEGCLFDQARSDALDVDISSGKVVLSRFRNSGNDTLDLMTSNMRVDNCVFTRAGDKGISVGEKSTLSIDRCVFRNCNVGIEIKDRSVVTFERNVLRNCQTAISLYKKNWRYGGGGILNAGNIYAIQCGTNLKKDKHSKARFNAIKSFEPDFPVFRKTLSDAAAQASPITDGSLR